MTEFQTSRFDKGGEKDIKRFILSKPETPDARHLFLLCSTCERKYKLEIISREMLVGPISEEIWPEH